MLTYLAHMVKWDVQDDETTLLEEEEIAKAESNDTVDEVKSCISSFSFLKYYLLV